MGRTVPAVARALDILELFLNGGHYSSSEITRKLDLPRTSAHELVNTLVARSYLVPAPEPGKYRLGVPLFQLGSVFAEELDLARDGHEVIAEVAARCGETVHLAILEGTEVVYIGKVDSSHQVRLVSAVGRRLPAHCTAVGKILLSTLADEEFDARYPGKTLPAMTDNSVTSVSALKTQLARIRRTGIATEYCECSESAACVAAAVRDAGGAVVAAMSIGVPILRWDERAAARFEAQVTAGAAQLSARLGHRQAGAVSPEIPVRSR